MESAWLGPSSRWPTALILLATVLALNEPMTIALAANSGDMSTAERLVADALRAEIAGDAARRSELLNQAIQTAPAYEPAHWQSGQIERDGKWTPIEELQRSAAADPRRAEYLSLREKSGDNPNGQLSLARWCRKYGLSDEAKFHWATVLASQPSNEDAQRALGVRPYKGRLMTTADIEQTQQELKDSQRVAKQYAPRVSQWQRLLAAGDLASRDKALEEIRAIDDPRAIPAMEDITLGERLASNSQFERCLQVSQAFVAALDGMHGQAATKSLVRHAVFSPLKSVREAATAALKKRPPHDYLPLLLAGLTMPLESSFRVVTDDDGSVHYWHSLYREGRDADWSFEGRFSAMQEDLQGPMDITVVDRRKQPEQVTEYRDPAKNDPAMMQRIAAVADRNQRRFGARAVAAETAVARVNEATESLNARIVPVLTATTGEDIGDNPRGWWDWWDRYNEYSSGYEHPVNEQRYADSSHDYYRPPGAQAYSIDPPPPPQRYRRSCFAKGTLVWTNTGRRPIETLVIGDMVLSQNIYSGELAYKSVIGRTVRPPSPMVKLSFDGEQIRTTLGHPLWLDGTGWQMAKELREGAVLHCVRGPVRLAKSESETEDEAYNLIVADFNTYFVGENGLLAHDNMPRQPTTATVPGLAAE